MLNILKDEIIYNKHFISIMTIIITSVLCIGCGREINVLFQSNNEGIAKALAYADNVEIENSKINSVVSITSFKNGFLGTYYSYLCYYDEEEKIMMEVPCPDGYYTYNDISQGIGSLEKVWNPTGCFYDNNEDLLYIANYHGHNILVCTIDDNFICKVVQEITTELMVSPENICVSDNGKMAVADYDGNALFLFNKDGELLWSKEIKLAHGVAMSDNYVYATGLCDRTISKFDLDGNLIKEIGEQGYEGKDKFMWPTSLDYFNNRLLIADAHTGRIYLYDDSLNYISSIGGNGASSNTFNFPYCATYMNDKIYITDTFNNRIVKLNVNGEITDIWGETISFEDDLVIHPYNNIPYSYGEIIDIDSSVINPYIDAIVISGYGGLYFATDDYAFQMNMSDYLCNQSILDKEVPFIDQLYITWAKQVSYNDKTYYVFGSPQTKWYFFIYNETDKLFYLYDDSDVDINLETIWYVEGNWYSVGDIDQMMNYIIEKGEKHTESFLEFRNNGVDRKTAYEMSFLDYYNEIFGVDMTIDEFDTWLSLNFSSESGKEFWNSYDENEEVLEKQTDAYFANTSAGNAHLCEMFFVHTFGNYINAEK